MSWRSAQVALNYHSTLPIYFAPVDGEGLVEYQAILNSVYLNPKKGDRYTEKLLASCLDETRGEGLWEKYEQKVGTLYVIRQCRKLQVPFPMTSLVKLSDDKPISEGYKYSYTLVYEHSDVPESDIEIHPEEVQQKEQYIEGAVRTVSVNAYERSKKARMKCIDHYGLDCVVCGFNFGKEYGSIGEGFIHVHHLKSLAEIDSQYKVNPIADLKPVCPNCHAMLHTKNPPFSIDNLKDLRKRQDAQRRN